MFLCVNAADLIKRDWESVDFVVVSGDAYVDHPSFGVAIISRLLEKYGYRVAILAQPDWNNDEDWLQFGRPRLGFLVTAGNIDSMVSHYSVNKKRRKTDAYSDEGKIGRRPDRATIVYCQCLRRLFKDVPIIIGGIEASLRKLAHYDYWDDKIRQSILYQSGADLLVYGMGEKAIVAIAEALASGLAVKDINYITGTAYKTKDISNLYDFWMLPSYNEVLTDADKYIDSVLAQHENSDALGGKTLIEEYPDQWYIVVNPPSVALSEREMDEIYALPFERNFHPQYTYIPAIEEVKFSIIANRGCFGACAFCALTLHQSRTVSSRSVASVVSEAEIISNLPDFKGYIHDIGGPTANFLEKACVKQLSAGVCAKRQCLTPQVCPNLSVSHQKLLAMLKAVRELPKIKKVFIRSGLRYDYLLLDSDQSFFENLVKYHISGQLKVAPEHCNDAVLGYMQKSKFAIYQDFCERFVTLNKQYNKKQYLVPYLISSHPGCGLAEAIELACYLKSIKHTPQQVQDFYPTPGTLATCMYYSQKDLYSRKKIFVAKTYQEKIQQRALLQYSYPKNYEIVHQALIQAGRKDLIGYGEKCLIAPHKYVRESNKKSSGHQTESRFKL